MLTELPVEYTAHSIEDTSRLLKHTGHLLGQHLSVKWSCFHPPPCPPINTQPGRIRKIWLQILAGDVDYLQIFPHVSQSTAGGRYAMITEAAVPLRMTWLGGGVGLWRSKPNVDHVLFSHTHIWMVEDTGLHCAFIRLWCRQISSLEGWIKRQEGDWVAWLGTMTVSGVRWCVHRPFIHSRS